MRKTTLSLESIVYSRFPHMLSRLEAGTTLGIMGLVLAIASSFLPWIVTETTSIILFETDWWMALLPAVICSTLGFTHFVGRRTKTLVFAISGIMLIIGNIGVFTISFSTLVKNSFAIGFYTSLGSASLLLEGGIVTYIENTREVDEDIQKSVLIPKLCPSCANDISAFSPSLKNCPFCNGPLEPSEEGTKQEELIVVESGSSPTISR